MDYFLIGYAVVVLLLIASVAVESWHVLRNALTNRRKPIRWRFWRRDRISIVEVYRLIWKLPVIR